MGDIKDKLFEDYKTFWDKNKDSFDELFDKDYPGYAPKIEIGDFDDTIKNGLLFVSCNPSGADTKYYKSKNVNKEKVIWYKPEKGKDTSGFLDALETFSYHCGYNEKYSKLDVFCIVKSKQEDVKNHYKRHKEIYGEMFKIFLKTVEKLQPEVIVVANAFVSDLLKNAFKDKIGYIDDQDSDYGGHEAKIGDCPTYIFFTSMLSGGRALDVGSRELLAWAVKRYKYRKIKHMMF